MQARQYNYPLILDEVEKSVRETPQNSTAHLAVGALIERRIEAKMAFDSPQVVEKFDSQPRPRCLILNDTGLCFRCSRVDNLDVATLNRRACAGYPPR
jgi:hypothetical protein